jgi:hypothetical protein
MFLIYIQQDATLHSLFYMVTALHVSGGPPPIIRSANNFIYSIWYLSDRYCHLPLAEGSSNGLRNTRCCRYSCLRSWLWVEDHPEHVEQLPYKINCVTLHIVGYILEYYYDARTHDRQVYMFHNLRHISVVYNDKLISSVNTSYSPP